MRTKVHFCSNRSVLLRTKNVSIIFFLNHNVYEIMSINIVEWEKPHITKYLFINIKQLDALNFIISLFQASTCFEHMCSSSGGQKLYYIFSGIITLCRCDDTRDCIIQLLTSGIIKLCRCDYTRDCIIQFLPS